MRNLDDSDSWRTFFDTYWRLIYNVARKSGLSEDQAQEVVQETVIAVARKMPEFRYDPAQGSFKSWLLLICRRRIHDHLRRVYRARELATQGSEELDEMKRNDIPFRQVIEEIELFCSDVESGGTTNT